MSFPFALATPAWTALAAVGGAFVGATAGGLVEWGMERSRSARLAKAGARLVAGDLSFADSNLADIERGGRLWRFYVFPIASWPEYREALAMKLSTNDFEAVAQAAMDLQVVGEDFPKEKEDLEQVRRAIGVVRGHLAVGYNALAALAGHELVGETIHPSDKAPLAPVDVPDPRPSTS